MSGTLTTDRGIDEEIQSKGPFVMQLLLSGVTSHRPIVRQLNCREHLVRKLRYELLQAGLIEGDYKDAPFRPVIPVLQGANMNNQSFSNPSDRYHSKGISRVREIDESLKRTILKMHRGGWPSALIADYLTGTVGSKIGPIDAETYLIEAYGSRDKFKVQEKNNIQANRLEYETEIQFGEKVKLPGDRF